MAVARETVAAISLPPREAIAFLAQKVNVTTTHWTDVWRTAHSRAFMVAGAATEAVVQDFRDAVTRAIEQGRTPADFRRDFDDIVRRNGWAHNGSAAWRANLIYDVNLSMAYSAGRWAQQTRPENLAAFPYLQYQHSGAAHPRRQHLAWNGLVLRADDPWWQTHYPPNGWRCGCRARSRSARDLARMGKAGPDAAPAVTTREWTNPRTGERSQVPQGIDPGFDYNPGAAWQGNALPEIPGTATLRPPPGWMPDPPSIPPATPAAAAPPPRAAARPALATERLAMALADDFAGWGSALSTAEAAALDAYKGSLGRAINSELRGEIPAGTVPPELIGALRAALSRAELPRGLTVLRGGGAADAAALAGRRIGETVRFPWFLSTTIDERVARDYVRENGGPLLELRLPRGLRGVAYVHPFPRHRYRQREVLALPGLVWRIVRRTPMRVVLEAEIER